MAQDYDEDEEQRLINEGRPRLFSAVTSAILTIIRVQDVEKEFTFSL